MCYMLLILMIKTPSVFAAFVNVIFEPVSFSAMFQNVSLSECFVLTMLLTPEQTTAWTGELNLVG